MKDKMTQQLTRSEVWPCRLVEVRNIVIKARLGALVSKAETAEGVGHRLG